MGRTRTVQACAIPYRLTASGHVEVMLVTTRSGRWTLPKGHIESGDDAADTARKETYEEAGVIGAPIGPTIGTFRYVKGGITKRVTVQPLLVSRVLPRWPEQHIRERRWERLDRACDLLHVEDMGRLLERFASLAAVA